MEGGLEKYFVEVEEQVMNDCKKLEYRYAVLFWYNPGFRKLFKK